MYFCRLPARCIAQAPRATDENRFFVGTCALQEPNQIHVIEFSEDSSEVTCQQVLPHDDEVWLLGASPFDDKCLATYSNGKSGPLLRIWKSSQGSDGNSTLDNVGSLIDEESPFTSIRSVLWDPHKEGNLLVADTEAVRIFSTAEGRVQRTLLLPVGQRCSSACLDPHHPQQVSTVDDTSVKTWDLRQGKIAFQRDGCHLFGVRDVDYNPNAPYRIATAGEDAKVRFWDLRKLQDCLCTLSGGHGHWVSRVRYNGFHDQLVLSCGTDSAVCLWRAGSVASSPLGAMDSGADGAEGEKAPAVDGLVRRYEEHEDSCYSCCWSTADAWVFASVSFDGKVAINRVPGDEKYRILL